MALETRKYLRVAVPVALRYRIADYDDDLIPAALHDISWGGAFLAMNPPAEPGTRLILELHLEEDNVTLELWGTVVRVQEPADNAPAGVGVEFDPLDDESRSLIQQLVDEEIRTWVKSQKG